MAEEDLPRFEWLDPLRHDQPDPMTPLHDALWAVMVMGRHDDRDGDGVADQAGKQDPTIPTPKRASHKVEDRAVCGYPVDRTAPDWPAPFGAVDVDGNPAVA